MPLTGPRRGGRLRRLAANAALAAASVLVAFGLAEAALRVTGLAPAEALHSPDLETLDRIPGLYDPGQEFTDRVRRDLPHRVRINNLGFRGRDLPERKESGTLRVMALGDSYTFGDKVDTEDAWPARLEEELRERMPGMEPAAPRGAGGKGEARRLSLGRPGVEVINAGVNGFGILDVESLWARAGGRLDPGIVLIAFSTNDITDMARPVTMIDLMRRNAAIKSQPLVGPLLRALQGTAVFNGLQILAARTKVASGGGGAPLGEGAARAGPRAAPEAWGAYRAALERLARALSSEGRRTMLVLFPSQGHVTGEEVFHAAATLRGWAAEVGIACLDLLPAMRSAAERGEKLYLVPLDSHPAAAGHAAAARAIAGEIERLGWLDTP